MNNRLGRLSARLSAAAAAAASLLFALLFAASLLTTAQLRFTGEMSERVVFLRDSLPVNLALTAALIALLALLCRALTRLAHADKLLGALWLAGTVAFLWGANTVQLYDFANVLEAAQLFAQGNYKVLSQDYFNAYTYQLGFCLPVEMLLRLFPELDANRFMQAVNAACSVGAAAALSALCGVLADASAKPSAARPTIARPTVARPAVARPAVARQAAVALYLTFLPAAFFCAFFYATLPMVFLCACAFLCFALYQRRRRMRFALGCIALLALAYMLKPNAAVPLIALLLCAALDAMRTRDAKLPLCMALSAALALLLARLAVWQYELRGGVKLGESITALARMTMGLQRDGAMAGWFNRYTEQFYPVSVSVAQEKAIAAADLAARLRELAADPAAAAALLRDKLLSQWLEPTYGALWYGEVCAHSGPLAGAAQALYAPDGPVRAALERAMDVWQQAAYLLAAVGAASAARREAAAADGRPSWAPLPLAILGGCLYHMLFEAKSQYIYVYAFYMVPLCAQGLCALTDAAGRLARQALGRGRRK